MSENSKNKDIKKRRRKPPLKQVFLGILILLLLIVISTLLYIQYKRNNISKDLLLLVNKELKGDFSVKNISVGSLFSYPKIDISLTGLQFHAAATSPSNGELIIDLPQVKLNTDISKIFSNQILINTLTVENGVLYIGRDSLGTMIISDAFKSLSSKPSVNDSKTVAIQIANINLLKTEIIILDQPTGNTYPFKLESTNGNFTMEDKKITGWVNSTLNPLQFDQPELNLLNEVHVELKTNYSIQLNDKKVDVSAKELKIDNELYQGNFFYNYSDKSIMNIELHSHVNGIDLKELLTKKTDSLNKNSNLNLLGRAHFKSNLSWKPKSQGAFLENVDVSFNLEGKDLKIKGVDLDAIIEKLKRSQNFNLADLSAVMFIGPAGLAITKGGDFASLAFVKAGDSSKVNHFLSEWELHKGRLVAKDVALSTDKNRIAVGGWYRFQSDSLDFSINIVDKRGCDMAGQKIYGDAKNPQRSKIKLLKAFLGPVKNFLRNIDLSNCEILYEGKVEHPVEHK